MTQSGEELAYERGTMDFYYYRPAKPNIWLDGSSLTAVTREDMTEGEIKAYYLGYEEETERKEWDWS